MSHSPHGGWHRVFLSVGGACLCAENEEAPSPWRKQVSGVKALQGEHLSLLPEFNQPQGWGSSDGPRGHPSSARWPYLKSPWEWCPCANRRSALLSRLPKMGCPLLPQVWGLRESHLVLALPQCGPYLFLFYMWGSCGLGQLKVITRKYIQGLL